MAEESDSISKLTGTGKEETGTTDRATDETSTDDSLNSSSSSTVKKIPITDPKKQWISLSVNGTR